MAFMRSAALRKLLFLTSDLFGDFPATELMTTEGNHLQTSLHYQKVRNLIPSEGRYGLVDKTLIPLIFSHKIADINPNMFFFFSEHSDIFTIPTCTPKHDTSIGRYMKYHTSREHTALTLRGEIRSPPPSLKRALDGHLPLLESPRKHTRESSGTLTNLQYILLHLVFVY